MDIPEKVHNLNSSKITERFEIDGTPFNILTVDIDGNIEHRLTIGTRIISENKPKDELLELVKNKDWNLLMHIIVFIIDNSKFTTKQ